MREEHHAVLQIGKDLIEILLQRRENLFHVPHATAQPFDLVRNLNYGIAGIASFQFSGGVALRQLGERIEALADQLDGLEGKIGHKRRNNKRDDNRHDDHACRFFNPGTKCGL